MNNDRTHTRKTKNARGGFTLIEAIVIVIILGVLAAVIAPRFISRVGQSKTAVAEANAASLASSLTVFMADHGKPEEGAQIDILWDKPADIDESKWEPYVNSADELLDPWGNRFILIIPGEKNYDFDVVSFGADGKPGGDGENADIVKP